MMWRNMDASDVNVVEDELGNIRLQWDADIPCELILGFQSAEKLAMDIMLHITRIKNNCVNCGRAMHSGMQISSVQHVGRMQHYPNCEYYK
jgi:hypothetical protein